MPPVGGAVNVLVRRLHALDAPDRPVAEIKDFSPLDEREHERRAEEASAAAAAGGGAGFRAVAPPVMSFAQGRRR